MENLIEIGYAKFWTDNNILYCQFNNDSPKLKLKPERVALYIDAITKLCKGKAMPFLIDLRNSRGTYCSSAANLFAKSPALIKLRMSEAFILNSIGIKLLITSYKRLYDPLTPFSVFANMAEAEAYCREIKNNFYTVIK